MERNLGEKLATQGNLKRLPGNEYFKKNLLVLKGAHAIYFKNYFDWKRVCEEYRNVDDEIRFNDAWRWRKQKAIIRAFHNMIVSFRSYIEHIDALIKQSTVDEYFKNTLLRKRDKFEQGDLTCFIILLRNMMVHRQVYPLISKGIGRENSQNGQNEVHRFQSIDRIEVEQYVNSTGYPKSKIKAKPFLENQPDDIDVELVVNQHFDALNSFHKEVVFECISAFKNDLIQFRDEVTEHLKDFNDNIPINRLQLRYLQSLLYYHNQHTKS